MQTTTEKPKQTRPAKTPPSILAMPMTVPRTYTKAQVLAMVKVSWRTVQRWIKDNNFPSPKKLSACTQVFLADAVDAWLIERLSA